MLEGLAARLIAEDKVPVDDMEAAFNDIRHSVGTDDVRQVIESVQRFQLLLLEKSGNSVLREYGRRLLVPLYAFTLMRALVKKLNTGRGKDNYHCIGSLLTCRNRAILISQSRR